MHIVVTVNDSPEIGGPEFFLAGYGKKKCLREAYYVLDLRGVKFSLLVPGTSAPYARSRYVIVPLPAGRQKPRRPRAPQLIDGNGILRSE